MVVSRVRTKAGWDKQRMPNTEHSISLIWEFRYEIFSTSIKNYTKNERSIPCEKRSLIIAVSRLYYHHIYRQIKMRLFVVRRNEITAAAAATKCMSDNYVGHLIELFHVSFSYCLHVSVSFSQYGPMC